MKRLSTCPSFSATSRVSSVCLHFIDASIVVAAVHAQEKRWEEFQSAAHAVITHDKVPWPNENVCGIVVCIFCSNTFSVCADWLGDGVRACSADSLGLHHLD